MFGVFIGLRRSIKAQRESGGAVKALRARLRIYTGYYSDEEMARMREREGEIDERVAYYQVRHSHNMDYNPTRWP